MSRMNACDICTQYSHISSQVRVQVEIFVTHGQHIISHYFYLLLQYERVRKKWSTVSWSQKKYKTHGSEWFLWSHFLNGWLLFLDIRILCPTKICSQVSNSSLSSGKSHLLRGFVYLQRERTFKTNIFLYIAECYLIYIYILYSALKWSVMAVF